MRSDNRGLLVAIVIFLVAWGWAAVQLAKVL